jgi:MarR family transcriptional regulator for hemolysin
VSKPKTISVEQPVGRILSHLGRSFLCNLNKKLNHLDIERNYYALLLIEQAEGDITQQELADLLDTDKVSIVRIIDYLSDNGYVNRIKNANDRRKYSLKLTAKAKKETSKIQTAINEVTASAFKGISNSQKQFFYQTLISIKKNLNAYNKSI